jgi:hypothetical protein
MNEFRASEYTDYPSSQSDASSVRRIQQEWMELHKYRVRLLFMNDMNQALLLNRSKPNYTARMVLSRALRATKPNGYIQVSLMR